MPVASNPMRSKSLAVLVVQPAVSDPARREPHAPGVESGSKEKTMNKLWIVIDCNYVHDDVESGTLDMTSGHAFEVYPDKKEAWTEAEINDKNIGESPDFRLVVERNEVGEYKILGVYGLIPAEALLQWTRFWNALNQVVAVIKPEVTKHLAAPEPKREGA